MYLELQEYLDDAEKILKSCGVFNADFEAIGHVASYMMTADKKYDEAIGNRVAFRYQYGKYGVMNYLSRVKNKREKHISIDLPSSGTVNAIELVEDESMGPSEQLEMREIIDFVHDCDLLSDRQRECIVEYYLNGTSMQDIGDRLDITRQAVDQNIKHGLEKLKRHFVNES